MKKLITESIPVKRERIQELLDKKITEVTEKKMREISNRQSDRDFVDPDEEDDARSVNSLSVPTGIREKKHSLMNNREDDGLDSMSTCLETESINFEGL